MATFVRPIQFTGNRPRVPLPADIVERFPDAQHARWGLGTNLSMIPTQNVALIAGYAGYQTIASLTHPLYDLCVRDWLKWRLTYEADEKYIQEYVTRFSRRETAYDFDRRKRVTPVPAFAKSAVNEIKNAIFQRTADTVRRGGPLSYQRAVRGEQGGVDLKGATMQWFVGHYILPEMLTMRKVGVYVDNQPRAKTIADQQNKHPYLYTYRAEDIRCWSYSPVNEAGISEFNSVLLREYTYTYYQDTTLPNGEIERFRYLYIGEDGKVHVQFYDTRGNLDGPEQILEITKIPFIVFEISDSLLKDVANHQIALMNLESSDISYALKGNIPFYIEQFNPRDTIPQVKHAQANYAEIMPAAMIHYGPDGSNGPATRIEPNGEEVEVGAMQGRRYPQNMNPPAFIHPSPEPLKVSMQKQEQLKQDIRQLVHLALSTIQPKMASAESKQKDQQGLESGLSYIGLELERGERLIALYWQMYDNSTKEVSTVIYPKQWSLKTPDEIKKEVEELQEIRDDLPSPTFRKEVNKKIAILMLGNHVPAETMEKIWQEIDSAKGVSGASKTIIADVEAGILSADTATILRGYPDDEATKAAADHMERLERITEAQMSGTGMHRAAVSTASKNLETELANPAARGIPDLSGNPAQDAAAEKIGKPGRGEGK